MKSRRFRLPIVQLEMYLYFRTEKFREVELHPDQLMFIIIFCIDALGM